MKNILINGLNAKTGGGKSILINYLRLLRKKNTSDKYFVLTPCLEEYQGFNSKHIKVIDIKDIFKKDIFLLYTYKVKIPKILKYYNINVVFNLADIPIVTKIKQVFLFDWSYAVYPKSRVWELMDFKSLIKRKIKLVYFKKHLKYISLIIAQTEVMKERLNQIYGFQNIEVVNNAVSLDNMANYNNTEFNLPNGIKLLYLTYYYPHKNLEIFIPLAKEIKKRGLNFKLITTIEASQHKKANLFLKEIIRLDLNDIICNIGPIKMEDVPSLYNQCEGLLMPTLLESFSGTYVEAMHHEIPIFTSDLDFAKGVCEQAAFYFDPMKIDSILKSLTSGFNDYALIKSKCDEGNKVLKKYSEWEDVYKSYNLIIDSL